jgi:AraC-like DNA-binding protein
MALCESNGYVAVTTNEAKGLRMKADEALDWLSFKEGIRLSCRNGTRRWKLVHQHYTICVLHRGRADWKYRNRHFSFEPDRTYVCEPGEVHATSRVYCPGDFSVLFVDPEAVRSAAEQLGVSQPHFAVEGSADPEALQRFDAMLEAVNGSEPEVASAALLLLLARLITGERGEAAHAQPDRDTLVKARRWIEDRFHADPTDLVRLGPIAEDLGLSYYSLLHGFSKMYSVAPYELVSQLRAQRVLSELRRGPRDECSTLTEVAHKWGYNDSAHLSRAFRRHWGGSPSSVASQINPRWRKKAHTHSRS